VPVARLQERYAKEIRPRLKERLGMTNDLQVPRVVKVTLSMGVGEAVEDKKRLDAAVGNLTKIAGQKAVVTLAKKSVSQWKVREGMPIGAKVTLRGAHAYEFLDRLVSIVIPRIRDFRGLPKRLDGRGNYNLGLGELTVFPEIDPTEAQAGLNISISTTGGDDAAGTALLEELGLPFVRPEEKARG
jgi:large subunit ribosomal protein L5